MVSKSFRLSKPPPVLLSKLANNPCGINRLLSSRFSSPTKAEEVVLRLLETWLVSPLNSACSDFSGEGTWRITIVESTDRDPEARRKMGNVRETNDVFMSFSFSPLRLCAFAVNFFTFLEQGASITV